MKAPRVLSSVLGKIDYNNDSHGRFRTETVEKRDVGYIPQG